MAWENKLINQHVIYIEDVTNVSIGQRVEVATVGDN